VHFEEVDQGWLQTMLGSWLVTVDLSWLQTVLGDGQSGLAVDGAW